MRPSFYPWFQKRRRTFAGMLTILRCISSNQLFNDLETTVEVIEHNPRPQSAGISSERLLQVDRHLRALGAIYDLVAAEPATEPVASIGAASLFRRLQPLLLQISGVVDVVFEIDEIQLSVQQGRVVSLIVTELAHRAPLQGAREMRITLKADRSVARLTVEMPAWRTGKPGPDREMRVVESLNRHYLGGELRRMRRSDGRQSVSITFPLFSDEPGN
jgi:hypothetical protein